MRKRVFKCHKGRFYILSGLFVLLLITLMLRIPSWAQDVNFVELGVAAVAIDGLTVTVNSMTITEKTGSYEYQINYTLTNNTTDQAIDEGTFKMYYANEGGGLPQYGFFGKLFPGDTINKTYTFEELKSKPFDVLEYGDNFFNSEPNEDYLKWRVKVPNSEPNQPPIADAGPDQTVFESVNLDGSASSDPDGTIISWQWLLAHRTNTELDRTATASNPTLTDLSPGFYDVVLTVTDNAGDTDTDSILLGVAGQWDIQEQLDQAVADAEAAKDAIITQKDQTISDLNTTIASMYTQEQLNQAVANAEAAKDVIIASKDQTISDLNTTIDSMYTLEQLDQAVASAEASKDEIITEKDEIISDLNSTIASMFSQGQLNQAVLNERRRWDINADNKISLEEAIYALQVVSGIRTQ